MAFRPLNTSLLTTGFSHGRVPHPFRVFYGMGGKPKISHSIFFCAEGASAACNAYFSRSSAIAVIAAAVVYWLLAPHLCNCEDHAAERSAAR